VTKKDEWRQIQKNPPPGPAGQEAIKMAVDSLLDERHKTHGEYSHQAKTANAIRLAISKGDSYLALNEVEFDALQMIAVKISRICNGNPHEIDHWKDIAGYATLVVKELKK